ncbi:ABC transporter permease [Mycoplasma sp. E35C]|uniref:ABC transporter permease n=1 Tax=Mycoplasma sp. E35C TaxID=2801918 RepID=UPI001CA43307|nr:ABC transporter permease [Mycoplasma sp. E35C]QZX48948.1 ABC transporter permease [Mycoplasma sp. E35C]
MKIEEISSQFQFDQSMFERVGTDQLNKQAQVIGKPTNYIVDIIKRFFKNPWAAGFSVFLILLILLALIAPAVSPYPSADPIDSLPIYFNLPPRIFGSNPISSTVIPTYELSSYEMEGVIVSKEQVGGFLYKLDYHPYMIPELKNIYPILGTTNSGVDVWTNLWGAIRTSLGSALLVSIFATLIGVIYGAIAGSFAGKWIDTVMMRFVEIIGGLPTIVLIIVLATIFSPSNGINITALNFALIALYWTGPATTTRIYIVKSKDAEYVQAVRTLGGSQWRIIFSHLIPNISGRLAVMFVHFIPAAIFIDSSLVFLGLKSSLDLSLGTILSTTYQNITASQLHISLPPIIVFSLFTISLQIIANAINDAVDPRIVGRK